MKIPTYAVRRAQLERNGARMSAALSSETPVDQFFGTEILVHSDEAIDMTRAAGGLPLLANHDGQDFPIGRVEDIRIDGDRLRGDIVFSTVTQDARDAQALAEEGTLRDVSVRYQIHETDPENPRIGDTVRVTRWTPLEASLVSVPADPSVGVGRSITETVAMPDEVVTPETPAAPAVSDPSNSDILASVRERSTVGFTAGADAENMRLNAIRALTATLCRSLPDLASDLEALAEHCNGERTITAERHQALALELIGGAGFPLDLAQRDDEGTPDAMVPRAPSMSLGQEPPARRQISLTKPGDAHRGLVTPGGDAKERAARGMELAILERAGTVIKPEDMEGNIYRGWSLLDLSRECLELNGISVRGMSAERVAKMAIGMGQRSVSPGTAQYATTDFPAVTEAVITKRVHDAFAAAEVTWNQWCSSIEVPDFKQFTIPRLSQIASLPIVAENAQYQNLTRVDAKEAATLVKRGGLISLTWEAIVNDDQRMFAQMTNDLGEAAARTLDENAYGILTQDPLTTPDRQGPLMGDGNSLFDDANHGNLGTAALDLDGVIATRTKMARQTDDNSQLLGIVMRYIIVPEELRDSADNLAGSEYLPFDAPSGTGGAQRVNTVRGTFTVVATVRLTDVTDWFAAANRGTVEIAFLAGNRLPAVMREEGWQVDALHWKVRHPSIAYPVDWRGLQFNKVTG